MTVLEHMLAAEAQMLVADALTRPLTPEEKASAHLHTAMFHLELAIATVRGLPVAEPALADD